MAKDNRPWIKVTVDMWRHPKITALSMPQRWALIGLWSLSMEYRTDGVVDASFARRQGITARVCNALADAELLSFEDGGQTMILHDYLDHQMSAAELDKRTDQRRSAGKKGGQAKARNRSGPLGAKGSGPLDAERSGPPSDTRGHARASEEEKEGEGNTSSAAADTYVPRERGEQPQPFSDGWIPPEPPADDPPPTRGSLALVHDADAIPTEISAHTHRAPAAISDSARTLVRLHAPPGIPRKVRADLAEQVQKLANDPHVNRADIETGLTEWARRPGAGPRLLPNLVADAARQRTTAASKPVGIGKPTEKAASIHAAGQALINELRKNQ
ncbi:hypothetical protein JVX90_00095 [Gordonia sp. PDNC005]|uniref:hypothetical protein n=1 Tax=Gordonia sp. PDNC005 TaxID=2811424 RepID=UPI0019642673|nr:hypothetical protein [Gordonia sp. PDNC005]QRY62713.1 hypothetical protein JVX90_00095 [Gordonia sp. PDNC005]